MTSATLTPFKTKKPLKQTISTVVGWKKAMKDFPEHYVDAEFMERLEKGIKLKAIKVEPSSKGLFETMAKGMAESS